MGWSSPRGVVVKAFLFPEGVVYEVAHSLKTWPDVFQDIVDGNRVHEFRKNDRDFKIGDLLHLQEFRPVGEQFTGRDVVVQITAISHGPEWGIPEGFVAFSIQLLEGRVVMIGDSGEGMQLQ